MQLVQVALKKTELGRIFTLKNSTQLDTLGCLMSPLAPAHRLNWQLKIRLVRYECDGQNFCTTTLQVVLKGRSPFPSAFCVLFTRCKCEISPTDSANLSSGV